MYFGMSKICEKGTVIQCPHIFPTFKNRDINHVINYQPIFIISIISKIYKGIVKKKISQLS